MDIAHQRQWVARGPQPATASLQALQQQLALEPLVAEILVRRGYEAATSQGFLQDSLPQLPNPSLLPGCDQAAGLLQQALAAHTPIAIHGDYDVDGITGTALLAETLKEMGGTVNYHIPHRLEEGYGLSQGAIDAALAQGCRLLVSVDCGIGAVAEVAYARQQGMTVIITDHHQPPDKLPQADAILNPQLDAGSYPYVDLAGVGVAFMLLIALRGRLRQAGWFGGQHPEPDLRQGLDLVALGTIADLVPLTGINRILVRAGLQQMRAQKRPGLVQLQKVAGVTRITASNVAFQLAPRINAAGRLEDGAAGLELLLSSDDQQIQQWAEFLDRCNQERKAIEEQTLQQAQTLAAQLPEDNCSIVLYHEDWHPGVVGIVASRMVERYYRPTVLLAPGEEAVRGSCRSIHDCHLYAALCGCHEYLQAYGGHAQAAGLSLQLEQLDAFRGAFGTQVRQQLGSAPLMQRLVYDTESQLEELHFGLLRQLRQLEPFGWQNPKPVFASYGLEVLHHKVVGQGHLQLQLRQNGYSFPAIAFRQAERWADLPSHVDVLYNLEENCWKGRSQLQLQIKDLRPSTA